ncbi:secreted antigen 3 [Babesia divergens]|uniref:Secreted antigen 3 n=1 Tax=Babesia divergens TaxID=32595 RepID=A0AAD9GKG5_BABDI|nr:secreted antigen 3 [Babesia divergens]
MNALGILRASGLFIFLSAFHGQPISCGLFKSTEKSKKDSNAKVSEKPKESTVKSKAVEKPKESNVESPLVEKSKDSTVKTQVAENPSQESSSKSSVPAAKSNLVFENATWDDSKLASSVLFMKEFCEGVRKKKFNEHLTHLGFLKIGIACDHLSGLLDFLTKRFPPTYGPGSVAERKEIDMDFYKDVLKAEQFEVYVRWLAENIPVIKGSFKKMLEETKKGTVEKLKTNTSVGPLKYGFVLKDCNRWQRFIWFDIGDIFGGIASSLELLHSHLKRVL